MKTTAGIYNTIDKDGNILNDVWFTNVIANKEEASDEGEVAPISYALGAGNFEGQKTRLINGKRVNDEYDNLWFHNMVREDVRIDGEENKRPRFVYLVIRKLRGSDNNIYNIIEFFPWAGENEKKYKFALDEWTDRSPTLKCIRESSNGSRCIKKYFLICHKGDLPVISYNLLDASTMKPMLDEWMYDIEDFHNGLAKVKRWAKKETDEDGNVEFEQANYNFVDANGNLLLEDWLQYAENFGDDYKDAIYNAVCVIDGNGKYNILMKDGTFYLKDGYDDQDKFNQWYYYNSDELNKIGARYFEK